MFGTKHISKHTPSNIFAKQIYGDPILNQIVLFHKWLDRNRDMLTQWNKKEMFTNLINKWKNYEKKYIPHIMGDQLLDPMDNSKLYTNVSMKIHMDGYNSTLENSNQYIEDVPSMNILDNIENHIDQRYENDINDGFFG